MANKKEIITILKKYSAAYPNSGLNKDGIDLYVKLLEKFTPQELEEAMDILLTKCKFFPTIAEIYENAKHREYDSNGNEIVNGITIF